MNKAQQILKTYWGHDAFRPLQEDIINAVVAGRDTLALMPTGGGKSICFQVPAMMQEGLCIVISPLIALMRDQVDNLKKRGIPAEAIYAGMSRREVDLTLDNSIYGNMKFLYVSPERLKTPVFKERLGKMKLCLLAVDEAHCISQWGYDFRPTYLEIARIKDTVPDVNTLALTASATPRVQEDIIDKLALKNAAVFKKSFARDNLSYSVFKVEDKDRKLLEILRNVDGSSVVYVMSRKSARLVAGFLNSKHIRAEYYHAGLSAEQRATKQAQWINNGFRVMVATNAFGMGIDKPDVRLVIHYELPGNIESYYQEAGRAGRDGKKAYAVLVYHSNDISVLQKRFEQSSPSADDLKKVYQGLANNFKLAIGSGQMATYDFDLSHFSSTYNFEPLKAYHAIKKLENEDLIQLNEGFYTPSKVFFNTNKQHLYEFQVANAHFDPVIKALLRVYGGELFTNFCVIHEKKLANLLGTTTGEVKEQLQSLHHRNVLAYQPLKEDPQITFLTARLVSENLPIDTLQLAEKRQLDQQKIDAMTGYVSLDRRCRSQYILNYFGEASEEYCGICDLCLKRKRSGQGIEKLPEIKQSIMELLKQHALPVDRIVEKLPHYQETIVVDTIRYMLDNDELKALDSGDLSF